MSEQRFGALVRAHLGKRSQAWLAERVGVTTATVSLVLSNKLRSNGNPVHQQRNFPLFARPDMIDCIAAALNLNAEQRREFHIAAARDRGYRILEEDG